MVGAHRDQFLQPLAHLLRRAVDTRGVGTLGVVVHLGEPAMELGAGHFRAFVHRHEDTFRNRKALRIASGLFQRRPQDRHGSRKSAMLEPPEPIQPSASLAERRTALGWPTPIQIGIGFCTGFGDIDFVVEIVKAAVKTRLLLGPQGADHRQFLAEAGDPALLGHLELAIMVVPAEPDAEDRAAVACVVKAGPLMRDHQRAVHCHHNDRGAEADFRRDRRRVCQDNHWVEAEHMVERVLGDPQVRKAELLGAGRDPLDDADIDRLGRAVRQ